MKTDDQDIDPIIEKVLKECYWDYNLNVNDIKQIISSKDKREKKKLFSKIIYNSKDKLPALLLFDKKLLKEFFDDFRVGFNDKYINRHILILRNLIFDEDNVIEGLQWGKKQ